MGGALAEGVPFTYRGVVGGALAEGVPFTYRGVVGGALAEGVPTLHLEKLDTLNIVL